MSQPSSIEPRVSCEVPGACASRSSAAPSFVVVLAGCWAVSWWTGTGVLGFGVALVAALTVATGALFLRELRRAARAVRRVEGEVRRTRRHTAAVPGRLDRLAGEAGCRPASGANWCSRSRHGLSQGSGLRWRRSSLLSWRRIGRCRSDFDREALQAQLATQLRQQQALLNLFALVPVRDVIPPMGGWAASADVVSVLVGELLRIRPRLVVECGSGVSTLWTALAIEQLRSGLPRRQPRPRPALRRADASQPAQPTGSSGTWRCGTRRWCRPSSRVTPRLGTTESALVGLDRTSDCCSSTDRPIATGPLVRYPAVPLLKADARRPRPRSCWTT